MPYKILQHQRTQAKRLGVVIKPSTSKGKKIDVFKNGVKVATIGAIGYGDFAIFKSLERQGKVPRGYADSRRKAYKQRHRKDRLVKGSNGYYADNILW
ncbi:MAG: hypothetical protein ACOVOQ_09735 [Flavobacterium sp.]